MFKENNSNINNNQKEASLKTHKRKAWLILGITFAVILVLVLLLYSPARTTIFGKAIIPGNVVTKNLPLTAIGGGIYRTTFEYQARTHVLYIRESIQKICLCPGQCPPFQGCPENDETTPGFGGTAVYTDHTCFFTIIKATRGGGKVVDIYSCAEEAPPAEEICNNNEDDDNDGDVDCDDSDCMDNPICYCDAIQDPPVPVGETAEDSICAHRIISEGNVIVPTPLPDKDCVAVYRGIPIIKREQNIYSPVGLITETDIATFLFTCPHSLLNGVKDCIDLNPTTFDFFDPACELPQEICDATHPNLCTTQSSCTPTGNYWYIGNCYDACPPGTEDPDGNHLCTAAAPVCDADHPTLCTTEADCRYWYNYWYAGTCYDACPPGTEDPDGDHVCTSLPPYCGDGSCDSGETCASCPQDCGECLSDCGDGIQEPGEGCDLGNENTNIPCIPDFGAACQYCDTTCNTRWSSALPNDGECVAPPETCSNSPEDCGVCEEVTLGDVNGDGDINVLDIIDIAAHITGLTLLDPNDIPSADANCDDQINVLDIIRIVEAIVNTPAGELVIISCP